MNRTPHLLIPIVLLALVAGLSGAGCREDAAAPVVTTDPPPDNARTLLALGDSYTEGWSVPAEYCWPRQLADTLAAAGDTLAACDLIARTGWTTTDLLAALDETEYEGPYDLVTLMIGVNNQHKGLESSVFIGEFALLLEAAVALAGNEPDRVLAFSIPDYGVTPVGQLFDAGLIAREIDQLNAVARALAEGAGVAWLDITPLSRTAGGNPALVARDGLHYSGEMYRRWVSLMLPEVHRVLARPPVGSAP